jgi:polar amino acid transport system substrate-binding protein
MKFSIRVIFILSIFMNYAFCHDSFVVSVHPSAHPYGWHEKNTIQGSSMDLINLIAKDLNITIDQTILPWARSIHEVKTGKVDAVLTAFYTKERAKYMTFTKAYEEVATSVFVAKGREFVFNKWDDLVGKTGLTIVGDSQGDKWDRFEKKKLNVIRVVTIEQVFSMLMSGRADYAVFPKIATLREIKKMGYEGKIINLPVPITSQGIYLGISKKSSLHKFLPKINQKIEKYTKDGTYDKFRAKAFDQIEQQK